MARFDLSDLFNAQSVGGGAPVQPGVQVTMIPVSRLRQNPHNSIYQIGDVSLLAADIEENGVRQPLEVLAEPESGNYRLIGGHRRLAAVTMLRESGKDIESVPCIVRPPVECEEDEILQLVTANATARELTEWERLRQYQTFKSALNAKKARGELGRGGGRIREALSKLLGESSGNLARLNVVSQSASPAQMVDISHGRKTVAQVYDEIKARKCVQMDTKPEKCTQSQNDEQKSVQMDTKSLNARIDYLIHRAKTGPCDIIDHDLVLGLCKLSMKDEGVDIYILVNPWSLVPIAYSITSAGLSVREWIDKDAFTSRMYKVLGVS